MPVLITPFHADYFGLLAYYKPCNHFIIRVLYKGKVVEVGEEEKKSGSIVYTCAQSDQPVQQLRNSVCSRDLV